MRILIEYSVYIIPRKNHIYMYIYGYRIELGNFTLFGGRETFRSLLIVSSSACLPLTFSGLVFRTRLSDDRSCVRDRSIKQATNSANLGWFLIQVNHRPIYRFPSKSIDKARDLAWEKFKKKRKWRKEEEKLLKKKNNEIDIDQRIIDYERKQSSDICNRYPIMCRRPFIISFFFFFSFFHFH